MKKFVVNCSLVGLALSVLSTSVLADSDCSVAVMPAPQIPAAVESGAELVSLHGQVTDFVVVSTERLECEKSRSNYNELVDTMYETADEFNQLLRDYKNQAAL